MYPVFKRILDFLISLVALAVLWPLLLLLGLTVRLTSPGPALFAQVRSGRGLKPFRIYKFRTMYTTAPSDTPTHQLSGAQNYITPLGAFLRKTSLDELPQLWNILRGDMALVGPRPPLPTQTDLIAERARYGANDLRPGLTGWAQINGRDSISLLRKMKLDKEYCDNWSLKLDLIILLRSVGAVVKQEGFHEGTYHRR